MLIKSPCVRNCCLDKQDICMGCYRHVDEIIAWQSLDNTGKNKVLDRAQNRKNKKKSF